MDYQGAVLYNWCWLEWSLEQIISGGLLDLKLFYGYSPASVLQWQPVPGKKSFTPEKFLPGKNGKTNIHPVQGWHKLYSAFVAFLFLQNLPGFKSYQVQLSFHIKKNPAVLWLNVDQVLNWLLQNGHRVTITDLIRWHPPGGDGFCPCPRRGWGDRRKGRRGLVQRSVEAHICNLKLILPYCRIKVAQFPCRFDDGTWLVQK